MTEQIKQPGQKPTHRLYHVGDGDNVVWTPIGAAWLHKDGKGFTLSCDAIPLHGRMVMRAVAEYTAAEGGLQ